jgi:gliding motility-associated-like protein
VTKDGVFLATLNAGQTVETSISNQVSYIQTSAPAYVYELSGNGCEASSAILPRIECTGSPSVSVTRSTNEPFKVHLLVQNGGQGNFQVNGSSTVITAANFTVVPGTGGLWYYAKVTLPLSSYPNGSVVKITNTTTLFQEGVLQGDIAGVSFGYFSDYNSVTAKAFTSSPIVCEGSTIQFSAQTVASATYNWTGPNGFTSNSQSNSIPNSVPVHSGMYVLSVTVPGCSIYKDSVAITVNAKKFTAITQTICEGESYEGHSTTGIYIDVFTGANGCDSTRTLNLTVNPVARTAQNVSICEGQFYFAGGQNQYATGIYKDTLLTSNGCDSIITTNLTVNISPKPDIGPDKNLCSDSIPAILNPGSFLTYSWQDLSITPTYTVILPGKYWVTVTHTANNCIGSDTLDIKRIVPKPANFLKETDSLCQYGDLVVIPVNSYSTYLWSTGSTGASISVSSTGLYYLTVKDIDGCVGSDSIQIYQKDCLEGVYIPSAFTPNKNYLNDVFRAKVYGTVIYFRLEVYNRFGELVFLTTDPAKGWDGKISGVDQNSAVFAWQCFYQLQGLKPGYKKGIVTLIH